MLSHCYVWAGREQNPGTVLLKADTVTTWPSMSLTHWGTKWNTELSCTLVLIYIFARTTAHRHFKLPFFKISDRSKQTSKTPHAIPPPTPPPPPAPKPKPIPDAGLQPSAPPRVCCGPSKEPSHSCAAEHNFSSSSAIIGKPLSTSWVQTKSGL